MDIVGCFSVGTALSPHGPSMQCRQRLAGNSQTSAGGAQREHPSPRAAGEERDRGEERRRDRQAERERREGGRERERETGRERDRQRESERQRERQRERDGERDGEARESMRVG